MSKPRFATRLRRAGDFDLQRDRAEIVDTSGPFARPSNSSTNPAHNPVSILPKGDFGE